MRAKGKEYLAIMGNVHRKSEQADRQRDRVAKNGNESEPRQGHWARADDGKDCSRLD